MFGTEFFEYLLFGKQLGLALAGAAALWGLVFAIKERREGRSLLSDKLTIPLLIGFAVAVVSWALLLFTQQVYAHEGIVIIAQSAELLAALHIISPVFLAWIAFMALTLAWHKISPASWRKNLPWVYASHLAFAVFLISNPAWTGALDRVQFFFIGHSAHSILTVGTVLILDFLYLFSRNSLPLQRLLFPLFPTLSKVILVGLGLDFLSVALVFDQAIALTPKFFFMQTVVGILIINGTLMAGPITRRMLASVANPPQLLPPKWKVIADVAGVVSITSWLTITFVDSFHHLTLSYPQLLGGYIAAMAFLYLGHLLEERLHPVPAKEL